MNTDERPNNGKWVDVESRYLSGDELSEFDYKAPLEEPLRISITHLGRTNELGIFMRSPGNDLNLVRGLIYNEGIISGLDSVESLTLEDDLAEIVLADDSQYNSSEHNRNILVTGSCGLCGRSELHDHQLVKSNHIFSQKQIHDMHAMAMQQQQMFRETGGTHGAAAFNSKGDMIGCEEDVGRHNAMDKLTGHILSESLEPSVCILSSDRMAIGRPCRVPRSWARYAHSVLLPRTTPVNHFHSQTYSKSAAKDFTPDGLSTTNSL